ncbi:peptide ABC transporter substrate-binding protein [Ideonella azotifigens]|uniref:Peptide ABC transporter substrate-binding protein n=1 Tax=Ideonella azotifigens TaxID=513160 RepID=A0ABN1KA36_9BURK|nr:peptide ABC transporter substrate-binding protein [Ideonella azotifigens]MCD2338923.1 peptide ABC transporter substrate-binding protein [Ideonella azotifigens]
MQEENELREWLEQVRSGALPRRRFLAQAAGLGLSLPMAAVLLGSAGLAGAAEPAYKPTKRGGGGPLKLLLWQGPTLLNPHFATGTKDEEGSHVFYEALARYDVDGNLVPVLAAEVPSKENGGISADGKSVTWKLKKGVTWHDGQPFTADDVVFNWQYATDPAAATNTVGYYLGLKLEKVDALTVRVVFDKPSPFWPETATVQLVPKHLFAPYMGAKSREAPANLKPVGTGPYKFVEFRPGDMVRGELNPNYHQPNKPFFDTVELKGGGDAVSAARAVLQTGEYDFAWNLLVEDEILKRLEAGGKGRVVFAAGGSTESLYLNYADPVAEIDGERSSAKSRHPLFSDPAVRQAMGLLIDRQGIQNFIFGRAGIATPNFVNNPPRFRSANLKPEFNIDKANAVLDAAGYKRGADGIREKGGKKLRFVFQTSINAPRQKVQAIIKQACQKAGIELELKSVVASVFFSSDVANPDTYGKFYADMQMYLVSQGRPYPDRHMQRFVSWEIAAKGNKWLGQNLSRWRSDEFDKAYRASETELDPVKCAALFIRMNDLACGDGYVVPLLFRQAVSGLGNKMVAPLNGWDVDMASLADWYRET